jgi:hypothetical protein
MMITIETKDGLYHKRHIGDVFIPLTIKVFGCLQ